MARPTKLKPEIQAAICQHLEAGLFRKRAAALVGVDENTFCNWFQRGAAEDKGPFRDFYMAVLLAEAKVHQSATAMLQSGAPTNLKLLLSWLARRFPEEFGRRDNVEEKSVEDKNSQAQATRSLLVERLERLFPEPLPDPTSEEAATPPAVPADAE